MVRMQIKLHTMRITENFTNGHKLYHLKEEVEDTTVLMEVTKNCQPEV